MRSLPSLRLVVSEARSSQGDLVRPSSGRDLLEPRLRTTRRRLHHGVHGRPGRLDQEQCGPFRTAIRRWRLEGVRSDRRTDPPLHPRRGVSLRRRSTARMVRTCRRLFASGRYVTVSSLITSRRQAPSDVQVRRCSRFARAWPPTPPSVPSLHRPPRASERHKDTSGPLP